MTEQSQLFMRAGSSTLKSSTSLVAGEWYHVAGVYDGTSITLYIDGIAVATKTAIESLDVTADVLVGQHFSTSAFGFIGELDEVAVHDRGLNAAEVFQLFLDSQP